MLRHFPGNNWAIYRQKEFVISTQANGEIRLNSRKSTRYMHIFRARTLCTTEIRKVKCCSDIFHLMPTNIHISFWLRIVPSPLTFCSLLPNGIQMTMRNGDLEHLPLPVRLFPLAQELSVWSPVAFSALTFPSKRAHRRIPCPFKLATNIFRPNKSRINKIVPQGTKYSASDKINDKKSLSSNREPKWSTLWLNPIQPKRPLKKRRNGRSEERDFSNYRKDNRTLCDQKRAAKKRR